MFYQSSSRPGIKGQGKVDGLGKEETVTIVKKTPGMCHLQDTIKGHHISGKLLSINVTIVVREDIGARIAQERKKKKTSSHMWTTSSFP